MANTGPCSRTDVTASDRDMAVRCEAPTDEALYWLLFSCCTKIHGKSNSREEGFTRIYSLKVRLNIAGKTRQQDCESPGHIASTAREQRADSCVSQAFSFHSVQDPSPWDSDPHSGWGFPPWLNLSGDTLIDTPKVVLPWRL